MNDNVRKVFEMLDIEPYEMFKIKYSGNIEKCAKDVIYYIDEKLRIYDTGTRFYFNEYLSPLLTGEFKIIKLPKKIKALTEEEYEKWYKSNCGVGSCSNCPFITTCM